MMDREALEVYRRRSRELNELQDMIKQEREKFEQSIQSIKDVVQAKANILNDLKELIKKEAVDEYAKTENKKLLGGIGIRIRNLLEYDDAEALSWAKTHQLCLSLNKKSFEKIAKADGLIFVEEVKSISVTFPKELKFDEE